MLYKNNLLNNSCYSLLTLPYWDSLVCLVARSHPSALHTTVACMVWSKMVSFHSVLKKNTAPPSHVIQSNTTFCPCPFLCFCLCLQTLHCCLHVLKFFLVCVSNLFTSSMPQLSSHTGLPPTITFPSLTFELWECFLLIIFHC